jgi:diguanylate cyclase (GGDEF)-like protein/PAS domain S-box-containing protein
MNIRNILRSALRLLTPGSLRGTDSTEPSRASGSPTLAAIGFATVVIAIPLIAFLAAKANYDAGIEARKANEITDAYEHARYSLRTQESLNRAFRLEPHQDLRDQHAVAALTMVLWLESVRQWQSKEDDERINAILLKNAVYSAAVNRMFRALEAHDVALANAIDASQVAPSLDSMDKAIADAASMNRQAAQSRLERVAGLQKATLFAAPLLFAAAIALAIFFLSILQRHRRRVGNATAAANRRAETRLRALLRNASDAILICDDKLVVRYQAPTADVIQSSADITLVGDVLSKWIHPADRHALLAFWPQVLADPRVTKVLELRTRIASSEWRACELILTNLMLDAEVGGVVATVRDITERKAFEQQLVDQAFYDSLTGLPNRALLHDRVAQALARLGRMGETIAVLFVDLDDFKRVNDSLGHHAGDSLLVCAAQRLRAAIRAADTVARLGGDEFVVLLEDLGGRATDEATEIAQRILEKFEHPFMISGNECVVSASVGVAIASTASPLDAASLLRDADVAMYRAKRGGKHRFAIFEASMNAGSLSRLRLEADLRHAIARDELRLHFQPIVHLSTQQIRGMEALMRWQHPIRGLLPPAEFIAIAEESGLIIELGRWALEEACRATALWIKQFPQHAPFSVSVNLSPRQFERTDLVATVRQALEYTGLSASCLKLEVTESVIMNDAEASILMLQRLKNLGIQIAIDDFGTGYSSLSYLKRLPLDVLKIDRSFIRGIGQHQEDVAIVQATIAMAKSLGLSVVAEGIETDEQATLLRQWSCESGQGFFFGRPMEMDRCTELLRNAPRALPVTGRTGSERKASGRDGTIRAVS